MTLMQPTAENLVSLSKSGDRDAFEALVAGHGLRVMRVARLIVRDDALAEDVFQETFIRAWRSLGSLRDPDAGAWLARIAANEAISAGRRRARFGALAERFGRLRVVSPPAASEDRLDLGRALDRLPLEQRAVVVLHYYEDLGVEATATALGIPIDTAKSRLKTALRRLRELTGTEES